MLWIITAVNALVLLCTVSVLYWHRKKWSTHSQIYAAMVEGQSYAAIKKIRQTANAVAEQLNAPYSVCPDCFRLKQGQCLHCLVEHANAPTVVPSSSGE